MLPERYRFAIEVVTEGVAVLAGIVLFLLGVITLYTM